MCRSYTEQLVMLAVHLSYLVGLYSMSIVYRILSIIFNRKSLYNKDYFYSIIDLYYCIQHKRVKSIYLSLLIWKYIGI